MLLQWGNGILDGVGIRSGRWSRPLLPVLSGVLLSVVFGLNAASAAAAPCDQPIQNPIVCENSKAGNPQSEWDVSGAGDPSIQGFSTDISVNHGQIVYFKIDTPSTAYHLDIYRMGYYAGDGARKVATVQPSATLPQTQPSCLNESSTGLVDCGNWSVSASWAVPADAVSGIYFAKLVRDDVTSGGSHIYFIVRDDGGKSDVLFQTSDTTWQAYNRYGGNSLYASEGGSENETSSGRAYKVSYNRPITTRGTSSEDAPFNAEYPMVRFLERNGYDVSYFTGVDADRRGAEILNHKVYLSVGHDEYWSGAQRANVEAARAAGVNLAFFSGNEVFWRTRWENSIDGSGTDHRTLVSYKETHANEKIDPLLLEWTGTWRDPRIFNPQGPHPENALTGTIFMVNSGTSAIQVPAAEGKLRLWRNTSIANLAPGETATLTEGTLGYEWDEDLDNGFRPAGLIDLSSTTLSVEKLLDYGSTYGPGQQATHHLTLYRAPSGALVFGAGTVQWSWGLDKEHDRGERRCRSAHAAGDRQPAGRHAHPARHAAGRPRGGQRLDRHATAEHHDLDAHGRIQRPERPPDHDQRLRHRHHGGDRRRPGRRRRSVDRRRAPVGIPPRGPTPGATPGPRARPGKPRSRRARPTTAPTSGARAPR